MDAVDLVDAPDVRPRGPGSRRRPRQSRIRRALYALTFLFIVLAVGTIGFHFVANLGWVNSFYFESMLATGQGPPLTLTTDSSKIYASVMAFVSIGSVLTTVVFTLGPMFARVWHEVAARVEREARELEHELVHSK
jgi:hypothetical protein